MNKCFKCDKETKNPKFCSRSCSAKINNLGIQRNKKKVRLCLNCGDETSNKKYCSLLCSAPMHNVGVHRKNTKIKVIKACSYCGKICKCGDSMCCSAKCQHALRRAKLIAAWIEGSFEGGNNNNGLVHRAIRHYLLEQANYKCPQCGWGEINPKSHTIPLEVDHIDGDWRNNRPANLRVLCPNCHSLTPTYKALNKTNFNRPIKTDRKVFK